MSTATLALTEFSKKGADSEVLHPTVQYMAASSCSGMVQILGNGKL